MPAIIAVHNLVREYRMPKRQPGLGGLVRGFFSREWNIVRAIDQVSFTVARGELLGYIGPNGAGKSTTFKMLTGILTPTAGDIMVDGLSPARQRRQLVRRIGVVFGQRSQLWWDLPLADSLRILQAMYGVSEKVYREQMQLFNHTLGLDAFLATPVRQLSLGQRMRGELAAAFLHSPPFLFLDEPLLGLDVVAKERVRQFIFETNAERDTTVLLASNDMADIERLCKRMLLINKGQCLYDGSIEALKQRHAPYRTLIVHFAEDVEQPIVDGAQVVQRDGRRIWFRFERSINPQRLIMDLGGRHNIIDLAIEEPTLEDVIRGIYERTDPLSEQAQEVAV
jgi:ABC-2 type transport system ATP-binding protein